MNVIEGLLSDLDKLKKRVARLETQGAPHWVMLTAPLTSTSWDGDAYSTTAKTIIDLSAVFSAPAGIRAVVATVSCRDSDSLADTDVFFILAPNATANQAPLVCRPPGMPNDYWVSASAVVPCTSAGDIYYQLDASGAGTMDVYIEIWGYLI